jgi:hypothetical protein
MSTYMYYMYFRCVSFDLPKTPTLDPKFSNFCQPIRTHCVRMRVTLIKSEHQSLSSGSRAYQLLQQERKAYQAYYNQL